MEYRKMNKLGVSTSLLGFGCMRFPLLENGKIKEDEAERMLDKAIAEGVNYIDTAYPYHNGDSEAFTGKVLKKYDRSSFYLATKLPVWQVNSVEDAARIFEEQLKRLDMEYIDFYLLHAMNHERWVKMKELGVVAFCEKLQAEGKIRHLGFSFHDEYQTFEEMLTDRTWDFCQIQYNYMDTEEQAGDKGYALAEQLGVPLVIMEPIKGGSLAVMPEDITNVLKECDSEASVASWAMRWVATHDNVKVILSGMSTYEQVLDNLSTFTPFRPLDEKEQKVVNNVAATIKSRVKNGCTACGYCMPCPVGVDIPTNFAIWNQYAMYQNEGATRWRYYNELGEEKRAHHCVQCGKCETVCPQHLSIRDNLKSVAMEMSDLVEI